MIQVGLFFSLLCVQRLLYRSTKQLKRMFFWSSGAVGWSSGGGMLFSTHVKQLLIKLKVSSLYRAANLVSYDTILLIL